MKAFANAIKARMSVDACGDICIQGISGNIHQDGTGYSVAVLLKSPHAWTKAKKALERFTQLRQDGDTEGVLHMPNLPTRQQAAVLRRILRIPKIRECSAKTIERLRRFAFKSAQGSAKTA